VKFITSNEKVLVAVSEKTFWSQFWSSTQQENFGAGTGTETTLPVPLGIIPGLVCCYNKILCKILSLLRDIFVENMKRKKSLTDKVC
jgi:hypothetical protein